MDKKDLISFDPYSATPKYLQLANKIIRAINEDKLAVNEILPSINELSAHFDVSRDTVEKGYKFLKKKGILDSVPGKGYYITKSDIEHNYNILMLFNKLSPQKKVIYDSFITAIGNNGTVDLFVYNSNYMLLKKFLSNKKEDYSYYVIIPQFSEEHEMGYKLIKSLPQQKTILLNNLMPDEQDIAGAIYENYENDIYNALEEVNDKLSKYTCLNLVFPGFYYPRAIVDGFTRFCKKFGYKYGVLNNLSDYPLKAGNVFILLEDNDLVKLAEKLLGTKLKPGKDVGIISYNENPLKSVVLNGITTISADFSQIGTEAAAMILNKSLNKKSIPFKVKLRGSL